MILATVSLREASQTNWSARLVLAKKKAEFLKNFHHDSVVHFRLKGAEAILP